jgi:hypothetical protein
MPKAKPISLHPLTFHESLKALINVDPDRLALLLRDARHVNAQALSGPSQSLPQQGNNTAQQRQTYSGQGTGAWTANNAPHSQPSTKEGRSHSNQDTGCLSKIKKLIAGISAQGFFNFIIAVATGFIAWFNWQLVGVTDAMKNATTDAAQTASDALCEARQANKIARDAMVNANRAWLGIHGLSVVRLSVGTKPLVRFELKNFGRSPAIKVKATAVVITCPRGSLSEGRRLLEAAEATIFSNNVVFPDQILFDQVEVDLAVESEEVLSEFQHRERLMLGKLQVVYFDALGGTQERYTNYRLTYSPETGGFDFDEVGNDAV